MITIGIPKVTKSNKKARLSVDVEINGETKHIWLEVDEKYEKYFVKDRCDAFVVALLPYAMKNKKELVCLSPVSEELLNNLRTHLIPILAKSGKSFYRTRISAEIKRDPVKNAGAVGTGMSGGIDSMHVLNNYLDSEYPDMNLTHLCIHDTGAFDIGGYNEGGRDGKIIKNEIIKKFSGLATELDLPLLLTESNIYKEFNVPYAINHFYCNLFPVFALQKLFKRYYYGSSGFDYTQFNLEECDRFDCGRYELLLAYSFSVSNLQIFIEGGEKSRFEKIEDIIHFSPAQKYLTVCMTGSENCNVCRKCMSTLLALDSLNRLEYFSQVFDVEYYKQNKPVYTSYLNSCHEKGDIINEPTYQKFKTRNLTASGKPEVYAEGLILPENINTQAILIKSMKSGKTLMQKQIKESFSAVALAKIMTAIVALESNRSNVVADTSSQRILGLNSVSVYDLINIMMITQNNYAADLIAKSVAGGVDDFVKVMNEKALQIGAKNTNFTSPTGLGVRNRTTAEDACKILEYGLLNKMFCQILGRRSYKIITPSGVKQVATNNQLLKENSPFYLPECLGAKFGVCGDSGNIIAVAQKADDLLIAVFLGIKGTKDSSDSNSKCEDAKNLLRAVLDLK